MPEQTPDLNVPQVPPSGNDIPKTKEDWDRLFEADPKRWSSLTQSRMDQAIRESREWREKAVQTETKLKNVEVELTNFRKSATPQPKIEVPAEEESDIFSRENMPQTKEDWDQLWLEDPNMAADLRHFKNEQDRELNVRKSQITQDYQKTYRQCVVNLSERHPDMYIAEKDDQGNIRMDGNGKSVLKINPSTGLPIPDIESDKFKVFDEVYREDPEGYMYSKYGTRSAMFEMERRLQDRGKQKIEGSQVESGDGSQNKASVSDQRGTMPGGVPSPASVKVSFASEEERAYAVRAVQRGIFKSLEEYCQLNNVKNAGIIEENRTPKFG